MHNICPIESRLIQSVSDGWCFRDFFIFILFFLSLFVFVSLCLSAWLGDKTSTGNPFFFFPVANDIAIS